MLSEDVMSLLNSVFQEGKVPLAIKELVFWRPTWQDPVFENFEPINDAARLSTCNPLWFEIRFEFEGRDYEYHIECKNNSGGFEVKSYMLKGCDAYPGDDPKQLESGIESTMVFLTALTLRVLDAFCKRN